MKITLQLNFPKSIQEIVEKLHEQYEVYYVGGCVRDTLLHKEIHDFDATTNATPDEMKQILSSYKVIETGIKHGTLTIINQSNSIEITTYRTDLKYENHRTPQIAFSNDIHEDLKRRDFTINALACDIDGNLIDDHQGLSDLNQHLIRCVGEASVRFEEDALRILRALRFAHALQFDIEPKTQQAIFEKKDLLSCISVERKTKELFGMLMDPHPDLYSLLNEYGLLEVFHLQYSDRIHQQLNKSPLDLECRLASLFYHEKYAKKILKLWKCSKKTIQHVTILIQERNRPRYSIDYELRRIYYLYHQDKALLNKILLYAHYPDIFDQIQVFEKLNIDGKDLLNLGYEKKQIKEKLAACLEYCFKHPEKNDLNQLIDYLKMQE